MQSRSLLASCQPVVVNGQTYTFENCEDLSTVVGTPFTFSYTLSGNSLTGAIQTSSTTGWSSLGFSPRGTMIGSNSIVVQPDSSSPTGASVDGYRITSESASVVNAAKGSFPLTNTAAQKSADGSLAAVFTLTVPSSANSKFIYAVGGLMRGNALGTHIGVNGASYGSTDITLKSGSSASSGTASPSPASPDTTTSATASSAAAPASSQANSTSSACSVTIDGKEQAYQACYTVKGVGTDFMVYYTLEKDAATPTASILSMAMTATSNGYVSVGFPTNPGRMTDASAVILQVCPTCTSGASVQQYWMSGRQSSDVQPNSNILGATNLAASSNSNGQLAASFKVHLPGFSADSSAGHRRRGRSLSQTQTFSGTVAAFPLIYAAGDVTSTGTLLQHYDQGSGNVDLLMGVQGAGASGGDVSATPLDAAVVETGSDLQGYITAHNWLMVIGWGVLIPIGIITARYFKHKGSWWFHVHRAVQSFAFVIVIIALGLGFKANEGWDTDLPVHRDLGIAATALGLVQVISLVARPDPDHKHRHLWYLWHSWIGRSAAILAIANIYYGILVVMVLGVWAWAAYTGVLGAVVLIAVVLEIQEWKRRSTAVTSHEGKGSVYNGNETPYAASSNGNSEHGKGNGFIVGNGGHNYA